MEDGILPVQKHQGQQLPLQAERPFSQCQVKPKEAEIVYHQPL